MAHLTRNLIGQNIKSILPASPARVPFFDAPNLAHDPDNLSFLVSKGWAAMQRGPQLADVDVSIYAAIFVPGGLAPMADMPEHPLLKQVIKETYERNAVMAQCATDQSRC